MSVNYSFIEKFHIYDLQKLPNEANYFDSAELHGEWIYEMTNIVERIQSRLAMLSVPMVFDEAYVGEMVLTVDGVTTRFSGKLLTNECAEAIRNMRDANEIDLYIAYSHWNYHLDPYTTDLRNIMRLLPESAYDYLTYSIYATADCDSSSGGSLWNFCKDNLGSPNFDARFEEKSIPEDASWRPADTFYSLEDLPCTQQEFDEFKGLLSAFDVFQDIRTTLKYNDDQTITLRIDNVTLNSSQEVLDFAAAVMKLDSLTWQILDRNPELLEDCWWGVLCAYFVDESLAGPRMMEIDISGDEPQITIAG